MTLIVCESYNFVWLSRSSRWHRLGISFKGNSVTVMSDCSRQQTRPLERAPADAVDTSGIILLAQQIDDNTFFEVSTLISTD